MSPHSEHTRQREHARQGLHLGWIPNDPGRRPREFAGPAPQDPVPDPGKVQAVHAARSRGVGWIRMLIAIGAGAFALFGLVGSVDHLSWFWDVAIGVAAGCWLPAGYLAWAHRSAVRSLKRDNAERERRHAAELAVYEERKAAWAKSESERVAKAPRWLRVTSHTDISRLDVFGGTAAGRQNMLTGLGLSLLERHAVIVLDLSHERVCDGLLAAATRQGLATSGYQLPRDLRVTPLLSGLTGDQVASQIVEVTHADDPQATNAGRAADLLVLNKIHRALGADASGDPGMARLHEALCFLLGDGTGGGQPGGAHLTSAERDSLGTAFGDGFRKEVAGNLVRLAAVIEPLRDLGTDAAARPPARLTCLSLGEGPRDVTADLTAALVVQWATQAIVSGLSGADPEFRPAVVLAGADEQERRRLGRLTAVCERYQVPLVRTFSRLTEESARHLDSRNTAFMRLPTRPEALRAAEHIGMERRFVAGRFSLSRNVSQSRTRTFSESATHSAGYHEGGSVARTTGTTEGESYTETEMPYRSPRVSVNVRDDKADNSKKPEDGRERGGSGQGSPGRPPSNRAREEKPSRRGARKPDGIDLIKSRTRFSARHQGEFKTRSWEKTEQTSHTRSESWSKTQGTSVGDEITYDLTYEHKVRPETLMDLPDDQMLAPHIAEGSASQPQLADSRMVALVVDPAVIGSDLVAPVAPDEIPSFEAPPPLVSPQVPDYARLPGPGR
jgi:hypothetical protein